MCPGLACPIVTGLGDLVWLGNRDVKNGSRVIFWKLDIYGDTSRPSFVVFSSQTWKLGGDLFQHVNVRKWWYDYIDEMLT